MDTNNRPVVLKMERVGKKYIIKNRKKYPADGSKLAKLKYKINPQKKDDFWALRDISFELKQGERLAIIGRNGAGKSTMLKLISRITEPTEGRIEYLGSVAAMLEVGTGFNVELTGRENVYLNGSILGMSKKEIDEKFDGIVEFAEIERFIDTPVKRYSSGMMVRLAFSVASTMNPDILIIDEVLSVGDMRFRQKCLKRMAEIADQDKTIICVSHVMNIVRELCDRAVLLENGRIVFDGDIEEAIRLYTGIYETARATHYEYDESHRPKGYKCDRLVIKTLDVLDNEECVYGWDEPLRLKMHVDALTDESDVGMRIVFSKEAGTAVSTAFFSPFLNIKKGESADIYVTVNAHNLSPGDYKALIVLSEGEPYDMFNNIDSISPDAFFFTVLNVGYDEGEVKDDASRFWHEAWGKSRISKVSVETKITGNKF